MKRFVNWRTASVAFWTAITIVLLVMMPNLDQLVRDKGQITVPDNFESNIANEMMNKMDGKEGERYEIIAVFNSGHDNALSKSQIVKVEQAINQLKQQQTSLGITDIVTHMDNEEVENQLVSEDGTTILTQIYINQNQGTITEVTNELHDIIDLDGMDSYLTGNELVLEDFVQSTQEGIKKTEVIAIVFILVILILVFKSPIVPVVSLLSVGVSYLVSLGIIAQLVDHFDYPFSNFTQVFLVVILFGIGTDYNILLFTRFKEELGQGGDVLSSIKNTYKTAGRTVVYSGLAVFIGFMALILAEFQLYRASSAVAIGVLVLILVLITLNPFFMAVLGKKMFWPSKHFEGHSNNKLWGYLSSVSVLRPVMAILFVLILSVPFIFKYSNVLSYNDLQEVDDSYASKQGIQVIEEHFAPGFSAPAKLIVNSDEALDNAEALQAIDELTETIENVNGVSKVYSVTRPAAEKINDLYLNNQTDTLNNGLVEADKGVGEINDGLSSAEEHLGQTDLDGLANVQSLIEGTNELKDGASALNIALNDLSTGVQASAAGAQGIEEGLASVNDNLSAMSGAMRQLEEGYSQLENGLGSFSAYFNSITSAIDGAKQGYAQIEASLTNLIETKPELASEVDIQTSLAVAKEGRKQLEELSARLKELLPQYEAAMSSFEEANDSFTEVNEGFALLESGVSELLNGSSELTAGLQQAADGSKQLAGKTPILETGLTQINDGQLQLLSGLEELTSQMEEMQEGLAKSTDGLSEISNGLSEAESYLSGLSQSNVSDKFFIPEEVLTGDEFKESLEMYMSDDRKTMTMNIILEVNPYSMEAMDIIKEMKEKVAAEIETSYLVDTHVAIGGRTSQNVDLEQMADGDFARTATIMLIGIGMVLIFITRSFWNPVYIVGILVLTYYVTLGMSVLVSTNMLGVDKLGWNVPFFSFIMIVALGVDYSIFMMMRYREMRWKSSEAIIAAAKSIGGVVISAVVILAGTFAALIPSGVISLIEIAITVIIGLLLLSFVMLPILLPALIGLTEKLNYRTIEEKDR